MVDVSTHTSDEMRKPGQLYREPLVSLHNGVVQLVLKEIQEGDGREGREGNGPCKRRTDNSLYSWFQKKLKGGGPEVWWQKKQANKKPCEEKVREKAKGFTHPSSTFAYSTLPCSPQMGASFFVSRCCSPFGLSSTSFFLILKNLRKIFFSHPLILSIVGSAPSPVLASIAEDSVYTVKQSLTVDFPMYTLASEYLRVSPPRLVGALYFSPLG